MLTYSVFEDDDNDNAGIYADVVYAHEEQATSEGKRIYTHDNVVYAHVEFDKSDGNTVYTHVEHDKSDGNIVYTNVEHDKSDGNTVYTHVEHSKSDGNSVYANEEGDKSAGKHASKSPFYSLVNFHCTAYRNSEILCMDLAGCYGFQKGKFEPNKQMKHD